MNRRSHHQWPPHDAFEEPETPVTLPAAAVRATIATLQLFDEFFRQHAGPAVHQELRAFCQARGWHPIAAAAAVLDGLSLGILPLQQALTPTPQQGDPDGSL